MKNFLMVLLCMVAIISLQMVASAQSVTGYSISDNNRDDPPFPEQQLFSFNILTGQGTLIAGLGGSGNYPNAGLNREYEGLASIGSVLYGVSQPLAGFTCNTGQDPLTGLNSDLRTFRAAAGTVFPLPNGVQNVIGPQIGETCADFGEESSAAYNPVDGFIYGVFSDDLLPANAPRSRLYRISPTTGLATQIGPAAGITEVDPTQPGDDFPYIDGLAILPNGNAYGSEARFTNNPVQSPDPAVPDNGGIYRIFLAGANVGRATFIKYLSASDLNRDTGAANSGNTIYVLIEDARLFNTTADPTSVVNGPLALTTPGCILQAGVCRDLEGFDIPQPAVR